MIMPKNVFLVALPLNGGESNPIATVSLLLAYVFLFLTVHFKITNAKSPILKTPLKSKL